MKTKAWGNLDAAQHLINTKKDSYSTAIIHCSYYAVFQYMKYILAKTGTNPLTYKEQLDNTKNKSSHEYIIEEIKNRIPCIKDKRNFVQEIRALKKNRIDSDYSAQRFNIEDSIDCRDQAYRLTRKLETFFGQI